MKDQDKKKVDVELTKLGATKESQRSATSPDEDSRYNWYLAGVFLLCYITWASVHV